MARKIRIHIHGGIYHVMLRGNGGMETFSSDEDRCRFPLLLQEGSNRFGYRVHAFCLMGNHVHLTIQVSDVHLSKIMQNLSFRYTRWFNHRQKRMGHLFQGRYKAILVEEGGYFLKLVRYIHLNPVQAEMVKDAEDYSWSGHNAYLALDRIPWLTTDYLLGQLSEHEGRARERYHEFVQQGLSEDYEADFNQPMKDSRLLGDDNFIKDALTKDSESASPDIEFIISSVCEYYKLSEAMLAAKDRGRKATEARAVIGWLAVELGSSTLTKVGKRFARDISTMSSCVRRIRDRMLKDDAFKEKIDCLRMRVDSLD